MRYSLRHLVLPVVVMVCLFGFRAAQAVKPSCTDAANSVLGADKIDSTACTTEGKACPASATAIDSDNDCQTLGNNCCAFLKGTKLACKDAAISSLGTDKVDDATCTTEGKACPAGMTLILSPNECEPNNNCCAILKAVAAPVGSTPAKPGGSGSGSPTILENPLGKGATIFTVIQRAISAFLGMVGAFALLVFIYAGVMWMTAGGEAKRVQSAKDAMKYAVIGIAMIAFAYALTTFFINGLTGGA